MGEREIPGVGARPASFQTETSWLQHTAIATVIGMYGSEVKSLNSAFAECIPEGAQVVLLDRQDPLYSQQAIEFAKRAGETDDVPDRPVVYMEVTRMAPVRSRLQEVRVLNLPPAYVTA